MTCDDDGRSFSPAPIPERKDWMGVLARASLTELERAWSALERQPSYEWFREPETGLVMVRGRAGGDGNPFNLGEMTVTRCVVRLAGGVAGHSYVAGRDHRRAELAAVFDAMMQRPDLRATIDRTVVAPFRIAQAERRAARSRKAASTKVDFFTLAREGGAK